MTTLGKWQRTVAPIADKIGLPGKMGVPLTITPGVGVAAADLMMMLARLADAQEARLQLHVKLGLLIVSAVILAVML
jgi:hypothetical protein